MSKECIIKYTIIPANDNEDYAKNFRLSLSEFSKAINSDKTLVCPLIVYNSSLDISLDIDRSVEDFIIYSDEENLLQDIRNYKSCNTVRSLIVHGFDITLDEVRDIYCPMSKVDDIDICINTIQDMELDSNLTFYLYNDLDELDEDEWRETKYALEDDMLNYIEEYKAVGALEDDELIDMLPFLFGDNEDYDCNGDLLEFVDKIKNKQKEPEQTAPIPFKDAPRSVPAAQPQLNNRAVTCSYEDGDNFFSIAKIDDDMFIIEDNDYEMLLTADQIDFLVQQYNRIKNK